MESSLPYSPLKPFLTHEFSIENDEHVARTLALALSGVENLVQEPEPERLANPGIDTIAVDEDSMAMKSLGTVARFRQRLQNSNVLNTAKQESRDSSKLDKFSLGAAIVGVGIDISPLTEWTTSKLGEYVLRQVAENGDVLTTSLLVGGVVSAFSSLYAVASGLNMSRVISKFPKTIDVLASSRLGKSKAPMNSRERSWWRRFTNVYTAGSSLVNVEDSITDENFSSEKKGTKRTLESTALVGLGTLAIGTIGGGIIQHAINQGNPEQGFRILGHLTNPLIWTGVFLLGRAIDYGQNAKKQRKQARISKVNS